MGGKGGAQGPSSLETEAGTNFAQYAQNYNSIDQVPGYAEWAGSNSDLVGAAQYGFKQGGVQRQQQSLLDDFMWQMQRPQEIQNNTDYQSGILGTLSDKTASFDQVAESMLRQARFGTENETGYDNFAQGLRNQLSLDEGYGFVWDENQGYSGVKDLVPGVTGAWRAVGSEEFAQLASDREGTMSQYGGLMNAEGNVYDDWQTAIDGETNRDTLYEEYLRQGGIATDIVNGQISQERQNAALLGINYDISDESISARINNEFANGWTAEQDVQLKDAFDTYGAPAGSTGQFDFVRGTATTALDGTDKAVDSKVSPGSVSYLDDQEDESLLGA